MRNRSENGVALARAWGRRIALVAVAALVAGCGSAVRLAYNNGDIAVRMAVDDYFDLRGEQAELFKARLAGFHDWHRRAELPAYAAMMDDAADRLARGLGPEDVAWASTAVRYRYRVTVSQVAWDVAPVLATLGPENLAALQKRFDRNNERFAKRFLAGDAAKRREARTAWTVEMFEDWLGEVTPAQKQRIDAFVAEVPDFTEKRFEDRKRRQADFVSLLATDRARPDFAQRLERWLTDYESNRTLEAKRVSREYETAFVRLVVELDRMLTPAQRAHAVARFRGFAEDFRLLAAEARPPQDLRAERSGAVAGLR